MGTSNASSLWPVAGSTGVTLTVGNTARPDTSAKVMCAGGVTVRVPHVVGTTQEIPFAVATIVVWPAALPVANPKESILATVVFVLCHCTVGNELDPPPAPPVPPDPPPLFP